MMELKTKLVEWRYGKIEIVEGDEFIGESLKVYGEWAQQEIDFLVFFLKTGFCSNVVVAGANIGVQVLAFASAIGNSGTVFGFEVHPSLFEVLKRNVERYRQYKIEIFPVGLWNEQDTLIVSDFSRREEQNYGGFSLKEKEAVEKTQVTNVQVNKLDYFDIPACDLLFLDVEGAELEVLQGAEKLIHERQPFIYGEVRNLEEAIPLFIHLRDLEYNVFLFSPKAFNPNNFKGEKTNLFGPTRERALLAVPETRLNQIPEELVNGRLSKSSQINSLERLVRTFDKSSFFASKIYWANLNSLFSEEKMQLRYLDFEEEEHHLSFVLPNEENLKSFRIDVYDRPGLVRMSDLSVHADVGAGKRLTLINLDTPDKIDAFCQKKDAQFIEGNGLFLLLSDNVHFSFQLPQDVRSIRTIVEIKLKWFKGYKGSILDKKIPVEDLEEKIENEVVPLKKLLNENSNNLQKVMVSGEKFSKKLINATRKVQELKTAQENYFEKHILDNKIITSSIASTERSLETLLIRSQEQEKRLLELEILNSTVRENQSALMTVTQNTYEFIENRILEQRLKDDALNSKIELLIKEQADRRGEILQLIQLIERQNSKKNFFKKIISGMKFQFGRFSRVFGNRLVKKQTSIIKNSDLFDIDFYLERNPDVLKSRIEPAKHYLLYGGFEGRNPSPRFNSAHYLKNYPDVMDSGMNPLVHYILFGKEEQRISMPDSIQEINGYPNIMAIQESPIGEKLTNFSESGNSLWQEYYRSDSEYEFNLKESRADKFVQLIEANCTNSLLYLSLSHDDYLTSIGGLQLYMQDEAQAFQKEKVSYLHFFPKKNLPYDLSVSGTKLQLSVNLDDQNLGDFYANEVAIALETLREKFDLVGISIHHLMSWDLKVVDYLLGLFPQVNKVLLVHDFFAICPQYNLLRNSIEFCGAPNVQSNACLICSYSKKRKVYSPAIKKLIEKYAFKIVVPSSVTQNIFKNQFPNLDIEVIPHVKLEAKQNSAAKTNYHRERKLRIAFLGHPNPRKGWLVWRKLIDMENLDQKYECYHLGTCNEKNKEKFISVSVNTESRHSMQDALLQHEIDLVLLWSIMPETFSYTLYESMGAGCYILTHKNSGNISKVVDETGYGRVLDNEGTLNSVLLEQPENLKAEIRDFQKNNEGHFDLIPNIKTQMEFIKKQD